MRKYETLYILKVNVSEKEIKEIEDRFEHLAKQYKGEMVNKRTLGKKPLAYPMKKEKEGIYMHVDYVGNGKMISEVEKFLRYDERVIRFMTTVFKETPHAGT